MNIKLTMKQFLISFFVGAVLLVMSGMDAMAQLSIVTSVPDYAAIAKAIGGDKVEVESLGKGYQNPHYVDAKPIFITKLNQADMVIYNGLDLEIGWLPILITGSRNSKISSPHEVGHYNASVSMKNILEIPTVPVDRSMGDVHPGGNPHFMLDPRNGLLVARSIAARLIDIDPENASYYEDNFNNFRSDLIQKISEWDEKLAPYKGQEVVTYHKLWSYFLNWAGLKSIATIEPKPGIPPSPAHTAEVIRDMERKNVKLIIAANYYPQKTANMIAQQTGAVFLFLPAMVEGVEGIDTYTQLFDVLVDEITSTLETTTSGNEITKKLSGG